MDYSETVIGDSDVFGDTRILPLSFEPPVSFDLSGKSRFSSGTSANSSPSPRPGHGVKQAQLQQRIDAIVLDNEHLKPPSAQIPKILVYKAVLNKIGGKDRLAKTLYYILSLIRLYLQNVRRFVVNEKLDNISVEPQELLKAPIRYLKTLVLINSTIWERKLDNATTNLSLFRRMMRLGGSIPRIRGYLLKFYKIYQNPSIDTMNSVLFTRESLGDFINLYYGICDELVLLYRLQLYSNKTVRRWAGRHEDLSWGLDIIYGQYNNWQKISEIKDKQLQLRIQHQVKQKAALLSKKLIENIDSTPIRSQILREFNNKSPINSNTDYENQLRLLKEEESIIYIDVVRLSFDAVCDVIDVFKLKLNPSVYLISGACSGVLGLTKVWKGASKELEEH